MKLTNKKGFTLIEVVIVLAIAALIMVIVFLAVQGAQRSQRDNKLKADAGRVLAAAEQYASNNTGAYPADTSTGNFGSGYVSATQGFNPVPQTWSAQPTGPTGVVYFIGGRVCSGGAPSASGASTNQGVVIWWSEVARGPQCQGN